MSAAVLGGVVTGAGIGAAQWALLRRRGVGVGWIPATAAGLGVGLAVGAALVSYRTDITSLAVMGAVSGLGVGIAQGAMLGNTKRMLGWSAAPPPCGPSAGPSPPPVASASTSSSSCSAPTAPSPRPSCRA